MIWLAIFTYLYYLQGVEFVCSCNITQAEAGTDRLFAHMVNNRYELLLTDRLEPNQQISLLCDGNAQVFTSKCLKNGHFSPALPKTNCLRAIPPSVVPTVDNTCPHTMYLVGFWYGNTFMELYRSCYDARTMKSYFSISMVYPTYLKSKRPPTAFDTDGIITPADEATFQLNSIYNRFEYLFGPGQSYVTSPRSFSFDRGHLTPFADYSFPKLRRQTNKYLNVVPQYNTINRSNWKIVENWVRGQKDILRVCTGALGVLELLDRNQLVSIYLAPNMNPVPRWTYKIISSITTGIKYVILTSNNGWETQKPNPSSVCKVTACPTTLNPSGTGYTFCCDPIDFIRRNVPNLTGVC
ncbi:uncharacterized protein LOC122621311 [Drosophila teissieri]|uniref:uncharacterized protein LOC122621311 n=1 Tax=Drosophila teissieri TaxID=7243 RepID=UPI001CBA4F08|nr:uncharacterized protein LOC122621311 [Drosophila teissieri]